MAKIKTIYSGESLPFCFDLDGDDISGWICTMIVKKFPADTATIERVIAAVGNAWPGFLTSTETAALTLNSKTPYILAGILTNASTGEEEQVPIRFSIAPSWG